MKKLKLLYSAHELKIRGGILIAALIAGNFFDFLYNAYLGRKADLATFALISLIGSILVLSDIPIDALAKTVTYKSAFILGKYKIAATSFWKKTRRQTFSLALAVAMLWVLLSGVIANFFQLQSIIPILLFTPVWIFGLLAAVDGGYLKGNLKFLYIAVTSLIEASVKLVLALLFVHFGFERYVYMAVPISTVVTFFMLSHFAKRIRGSQIKIKSKTHLLFPVKFYISSTFIKVSNIAYLTLDVLLAKHFLSASEAGQYALLSLTGKMVYFSCLLFSQFINPIISKSEGEQANSSKAFYKLLSASAFAGTCAFIFVGVLGKYTLPLLFGPKAQVLIPIVPFYTLAMVAFTIATNIVSFHQIRQHHGLPVVSFLVAMLEIILICLFHNSVESIAYVMVSLGFINLAIIGLIHIFYSKFVGLVNNILAFADLFKPYKKEQKPKNGQRILILNWRDVKHSWSGGAEVFIHEIAKRLVEDGNRVTLFCGSDGKSPRNQVIDGVNIKRRGGFYTVYLWAAIYYMLKFRGNFDVIIDSVNGIPFFSPIYSRKPIFAIIYHIHQEVFRQHLRFPFSHIAMFMEAQLMPFIYRNISIVTISDSSRNGIEKLGFGSNKQIEIVHPGIQVEDYKRNKKTSYPTIVYVGRLKPYKNVDVLMKAFKNIVKESSTAQLWIAGVGESMEDLVALAKKLNIEKSVVFYGRVSEKHKVQLLSESWISVQPSQVEGWGITVIEANACGTPVIASKVNGLKDSIVDGKTGILVEVNNVTALTNAMSSLLTNSQVRALLSKNAYEWSQGFSWKKSAEKFSSIINGTQTSKTQAKKISFRPRLRLGGKI